MATASVTYTFTNASTAQAAEVNTNFGDLVTFINSNAIQKDGSLAMTSRLTLASLDPTSADHAARKSYVDGLVGGPTGSLIAFAGSSAPGGWLLCFGQAISRSTFANLFAVVGTTYGVGDGSTTFNIPDLRGRVPVALDNMGGGDAGRLSVANTLGGSGGEEKHTLTTAELAAHTHGPTGGFDLWYATFGSGPSVIDTPGFGGNAFASPASMTSAGSGTAHNTMQPYVLTNWIVKT